MRHCFSLMLVLVFLLACLNACATPPAPSHTDPSSSVPTTNLTEIDFFSCVSTVSYRAVSGSGYLGFSKKISNLDYDKTNGDLTDFLESVKLNVEMDVENEHLHNGDVVTVSLEYSHSAAEALGITFTQVSKSYTVSGLVEALREYNQEAYDQLYPELERAVATAYAEECNPTMVQAYWLYGYDNCGDPYIAGMTALFTYTSGGFTEYDLRVVPMYTESQNLMENILKKVDHFWLNYESQSGITLEEALALAEDTFAVDGLCFAEKVN
ncbi:MAG: hypothetical protein E7448_05545 [Ruminococcaceae bacterium]|nr:hypothetical protein [Oscillospiraceae bacterium]